MRTGPSLKPDLPRFRKGLHNPFGARALYLYQDGPEF
jgi:hypothetical protein